jgi:hypothetical protein
MIRALSIAAVVLFSPCAAATVCVYVPVHEQVDKANTVFIAVVTSASSAESFDSLENGADYRVNYTFDVKERVKGDPSKVPSLFTINTYRVFDADIDYQGAETRLLPGDHVLVVASSPGPAQVAACTPSQPWNPSPDQLRALRSQAR